MPPKPIHDQQIHFDMPQPRDSAAAIPGKPQEAVGEGRVTVTPEEMLRRAEAAGVIGARLTEATSYTPVMHEKPFEEWTPTEEGDFDASVEKGTGANAHTARTTAGVVPLFDYRPVNGPRNRGTKSSRPNKGRKGLNADGLRIADEPSSDAERELARKRARND